MDIKKSFIIVLIILIFGVAGVLVWKSFSGLVPEPAVFLAPKLDNSVLAQDTRDAQRIKDLLYLSERIDAYNTDRNGYVVVTDKSQIISDEESVVFRELKDNGYLDKALKDPLPDKYYYSYYADGYMYELTAVLENKNSDKCEISGDLCVYKIKKEVTYLSNEDFSGKN